MGLDNPGTSDRVRGGTDVYSDQAILGTCSEERFLGVPLTAKLTLTDPEGQDGWFVEWIQITTNHSRTQQTFLCSLNAWLDNDRGFWHGKPVGPGSLTVFCRDFPV